MYVEKIAFKNMSGRPMKVVVEPWAEDFDLPAEQTVYIHLHHDSDDYDEPLHMDMHADGDLVIYEQRQNWLKVYIEQELVFETDQPSRFWAKKPG